MNQNLFVLLLILFIGVNNSNIDLSTYYKEFINNYGYEIEVHDVTTKDGYILSLWHIFSMV